MSGFIFDMDGVLLDSIHIWHKSERMILDMAGITLTKEQRDELNALTLEEAGQWFHDLFGIMRDGKQVSEAIVDHMLTFYRDEVQAKPGALEFVRAVHEAGEPLCVLSSSPQAFLQAGLAHAQIKQYFQPELIISAEDAGLKKRSPGTFSRVCELLGTQPGETWLFDDSWYALETARDEGLRCVGIYSSDNCGTRVELARYAEFVADDFTSFNVEVF